MIDTGTTPPPTPTRALSSRSGGRKVRGLTRHRAGGWQIRYTCGVGCRHKEWCGPLKEAAIARYHARRKQAREAPGWCPARTREATRRDAQAAQAREAARVTVAQYAERYLTWARLHHRGIATETSRVRRFVAAYGAEKLDAITSAQIETFLDGLLDTRTQATRNRYRIVLSSMFSRARKLDKVIAVNPVSDVPKGQEPEGRVVYLTAIEEQAIVEALQPEAATGPGRPRRQEDCRGLFTVAVNTGLRWSEQVKLTWSDVDLLAGTLTVRHGKNGRSRTVPLNTTVTRVLLDLATARERPDDPGERVFRVGFTQPDKFFPRAVQRAQAALRGAGKDASRFEGFTWHGCRHTFASRLVMAGVDLRTVQELGGWRSLAMVQRYAHLAPDHLRAAVEKLVRTGSGPVERSLNGPSSVLATSAEALTAP